MSIIILDDSLVNKIAAGEVIERPASVVKELIENALDAQASKIFVEVREGGKSFIKVTDDGTGMDTQDAMMSWKPHSTSKIRDINDLFSISSLGFRGEALASIAAVAHLTIATKPDDELAGTKVQVKAGQLVGEEEVGCPQGTTVTVERLFFNTPARKKYLKSIDVELRHISDIVTRYALLHNDKHFRLIHHDRTILDSPSADPEENIATIYGRQVSRQLIPIRKDGKIGIEGYISKPSLSKSSKQDQSFYINGRYIKSNKQISSALNDAYKTLMMVNRYPVAILNIEMDTEGLDVNVHPQKSEIRIKDEVDLYQKVYETVRQELLQQDLVPTAKDVKQKTFKETLSKHTYNVEPKQELLVKEESRKATPNMQILGIFNKTYIIAQMPGSLILIDQHAAAERILYERFNKQLKNSDVKRQSLLDPEVIELSPVSYSTALEHKDYLDELGYDIEDFGDNTILLRTLPVILGRSLGKEMFKDFLDDLERAKKLPTLEKLFHDRTARMACRSAIKAGDEITLPQIKQYVQELFDADIPYNCPHGRPIMVKLTNYELEKMFKRVV